MKRLEFYRTEKEMENGIIYDAFSVSERNIEVFLAEHPERIGKTVRFCVVKERGKTEVYKKLRKFWKQRS